MDLSSKHKYKHMSMLFLCVYYDLYGEAMLYKATLCKINQKLGLKI